LAAGVIQLDQYLEIGLPLAMDIDRTRRVMMAVVFILELMVMVEGSW